MFPFTISAYDNGSFVSSDPDFQQVVIAEVKRRKESWYAYDVKVISPTSVEITVFGMESMTYGGIGGVSFSFFAEVGRDLTAKSIARQACMLAKTRYRREKEAEEDETIARYANDILEKLQ